MIAPPIPPDEPQRLEALGRYAILDSTPEEAFDELARVAATLCATPIALISLIDETRQWFKARHGLGVPETPREVSFCAHAIAERDVFIVHDALADPRFAANPLVMGTPNIRFYAGAQLVTPDGFRLGTLCVIDREPRTLTAGQHASLRALARQVIVQLELRRQLAEVERMKNDFVISASHELRTPLTSIRGSLGLLAAGSMGELTEEARQTIAVAARNCERLISLADEILERANGVEASPPATPLLGLLPRVPRPAARSSRTDGHGMKVLVVDDEEDVRFIAQLSLGRVGGMTVVEASGGEEALLLARDEQPDFILLDMMMPGMDGAATFRRLQADPRTASIPVVFLTAKALAAEVQRLRELGAKGVVLKPFNPMTLASEITAILNA